MHQHLDAAERRRCGPRRFDAARLGAELRRYAGAPVGRRLRPMLRRHAHPLLEQAQGDAAPDAARRAGHQRSAPFQIRIGREHCLFLA